MNTHSIYIRSFLISLISIIIIAIAVNFYVDPLMIFRGPFLPDTYVKDERARIPGIIRNRDYDTAVVGASSAWAVRPKDVAALLGGKAVMLIVSGGTAAEEALLATTAAAEGRAKRIVWLLDSVIFNYAGKHPDAQMPTYLFRPSARNLMRYLLDGRTAQMSAALIYQKLTGQMSDSFTPIDMDDAQTVRSPQAECSPASVARAFHSQTAVTELRRREKATYTPYDEALIARAFSEHVTSVVRRYPNVTFEIVLPPATVALHQFSRTWFPDRFRQLMQLRELAYRELPHLPNARLYDLQTDAGVVGNYELFSDMLHFSPSVGRIILESIRDGKSVETAALGEANSRLLQAIEQIPVPK